MLGKAEEIMISRRLIDYARQDKDCKKISVNGIIMISDSSYNSTIVQFHLKVPNLSSPRSLIFTLSKL